MQSTGEPLVRSTLLRTRASAVHAGLSQLLAQWKEPGPSRLALSFLSPSNSSLIALVANMATLDAMVVTWELPSTMLMTMVWSSSLPIPTPQWTALVLMTRPKLKLPPLARSSLDKTTLLPSRPPSLSAPSQSPLRPTPSSSNSTPAVSSTPRHAEPTLTTVLSLSAMVLMLLTSHTTSSETHGEPHGDRRDTSTLLLLMVLVSAVSRWSLSTQPSERIL